MGSGSLRCHGTCPRCEVVFNKILDRDLFMWYNRARSEQRVEALAKTGTRPVNIVRRVTSSSKCSLPHSVPGILRCAHFYELYCNLSGQGVAR